MCETQEPTEEKTQQILASPTRVLLGLDATRLIIDAKVDDELDKEALSKLSFGLVSALFKINQEELEPGTPGAISTEDFIMTITSSTMESLLFIAQKEGMFQTECAPTATSFH